MKFQLTILACALALAGCASQAARDRLGIEDPTVIKTGVGASQDIAAGAVTPQWLSTYAPITSGGEAFASLQQRLDKLPGDKNGYFHAKAQCWIDAGQAEWHAHDQWGFVEEAIGQAAMLTFGLENNTQLSAANPELRTVSTVRPDLWKIVNVIKSDPATAQCPEAQQPLACAEVDLMLAGHHAWTRNFSAAEQSIPGIQDKLRKSAEAALQCAQPKQTAALPASTPVHAPAQTITLRADSSFRFNGGDIAALLPSGQEQLNAVVTGLQKAKNITRLNISGYTDRLGSDDYNQKLSLQRAVTVRTYLIKRGVTLPINVSGQGKAKPLVACTQTNRDELVKCLAPNRRVEIDFVRDAD
ncbi:OmpA family protein [Paraburkholderia sp. DHOC27]|uniref:OmpA family protein n=1 Tax=Paraburkholderia sp. DHOC27 TaxID=2303330 RepID=UPI000E3DC153|nr:OmpA family protein [Paraburkholderia sp. DHOC27]RFU48756.1 OmpA family protein [Paraburkholderia sp. DHOC27]